MEGAPLPRFAIVPPQPVSHCSAWVGVSLSALCALWMLRIPHTHYVRPHYVCSDIFPHYVRSGISCRTLCALMLRINCSFPHSVRPLYLAALRALFGLSALCVFPIWMLRIPHTQREDDLVLPLCELGEQLGHFVHARTCASDWLGKACAISALCSHKYTSTSESAHYPAPLRGKFFLGCYASLQVVC